MHSALVWNRLDYWTHQTRALDIHNFRVGISFTKSRQNRHRLGRRAVVVAHQGVQVVGVGANHRNLLGRVLQRKKVILILQKNDGFLRRAKRQLPVRFVIVFRRAYTRIRHGSRRIKQAKPESRREQSSQSLIDVGFREQPLMNSTKDRRQFGAHVIAVVSADQVHASLERHGHSLFRRSREAVPAKDVCGRSAIGNHVALKAPIAPQMFLQQRNICASRLAVQRVVSAHHGFRLAFHYRRAKRRQIGVLHVVS